MDMVAGKLENSVFGFSYTKRADTVFSKVLPVVSPKV